MARAILARKLCNWPCHNGWNHSCTHQVMQLAVPEWLEPFWHSSHVICMAVPEWLEPFWHTSSASGITCVQEWLEPFWHCQPYLSARMARAIQVLKSCIRPCQNGSGHSGTQVMKLAVPEYLEPFLHSSSHATGRVRMARAILALKSCSLHGCARMARAILAHKFGQWRYLRARMARAILALPKIFECHA